AIQKKVLKETEPIVVRPGSLIPPADLDAERQAVVEKIGRPVEDRELASYLMYPKVFTEFAAAADTYGPVSVLPTPVYFYGLPVGEEILVEIERGKTLVIRNQAIGEADDDGFVRVFFEMNGQPRVAKVPNRMAGEVVVRRKAEEGNALHVAAPMPGVISTLAVATGQKVKAGDVLLSIEAMKMETALHAERDGIVGEVLVHAGSQIDAKDLLMVYEE
ncbi:MAG: biotin/lipoyl-binding protein, partial [Bauldia sp.]|nr:biotin/lipoyl-binding protein [Bauldia sp.]